MEKTSNNIEYMRYPGIDSARISLFPVKGVHSLDDVDTAVKELNSLFLIEKIKITWGEVEYSFFEIEDMDDYDIMHLPKIFKCQNEETLNALTEKIKKIGFKFSVSKKELLITL